MAEKVETIVIAGEERRLGCLSPILLGKPTLKAPLWADKKPTFTLEELKARPVNRRAMFRQDWVKNQRSHGSCNGFSTAAAVTKTRVLHGQPRVDLSGAFAYSQMNGGRDNGSTLDDGMEVCQRIGIAPESFGGWDRIWQRDYGQDAYEAAKRFKVEEAFVIDSDLELASAILCDYIPVVAVHVGSGFDSVGTDGVSRGGAGVGNHSIHLDGYKWSDSLNCLIYDNEGSWGSGWGDDGRIFLTWERHFRSCRQYHQFWAVRGVAEDPKDDENPPTVVS